jgi:hypothetical protein
VREHRYVGAGYAIGGIASLLVLVGLWIYCIGTCGFLFGVGLTGWLVLWPAFGGWLLLCLFGWLLVAPQASHWMREQE